MRLVVKMLSIQEAMQTKASYKEPKSVEPMALSLDMPWRLDDEQDAKFKRLCKRLLILLLLLFIIIPFLPQIEQPYEEPETDLVITKVLLKPVVPPKPINVEQKKAKPKEIVKEIPKPKEITKPEVNTAQIKTPSKKKSGSAEKTAVKVNKIDKKISVKSSQGLNELSNQLTSLRGSLNLTKMQNKNLSDNKIGSAARSSRDVLGGDQVSRRSGGIDIDGSQLTNSSTSLAQHTTTAVDGLITSGDGPSGDSAYMSTGKGQRDDESIRLVFERAKSNVDQLYRRKLLSQPSLSGTFEFNVVIEPDGTISSLRLVSSELGDSELEKRILARIKSLNFGVKDVAKRPVIYKYTFLPS